jgi:hypothetical protein
MLLLGQGKYTAPDLNFWRKEYKRFTVKLFLAIVFVQKLTELRMRTYFM